jgi:hypothetical protein
MGEGLSDWGQHRRQEALAIGLLELITSQLCLPKNRPQQTRPNGFAGVHRNDGTASIWVPHEVMAAFDPYGFETQSMQRIEQLLACERWPLAHASTQTR